MIRILFTIPNFDTAGSGKALMNVASRLDPKYFEVHIACLHNRGVFYKVVEKSGIPIHVFEYTTIMKPYLKAIKTCYEISKKLKTIDPDIIHSFHYAADYSEPLAARMAGIKWVYTKKNMNWGGASKNGWRLRSWLAHSIVVQNTDMKDQFFRNWKNIKLIPRGVDTEMFKPRSKNQVLMDKWQLKSEDRILMCVANLVPVKGVEVLLKAFKAFISKGLDWKLMIVGDKDNLYGERMLKLSKDLGLDDKVLFCGKQNNIHDYLNLAEVFILPTLNEGRREGSPVALLEAMASGKNVLGYLVPGIKDQLRDYPSHMIPAGDVNAWIMALLGCCSNTREENFDLGQKFRTHVEKNYSIEKEVASCEGLYKKLASKKVYSS